MKYKFQYKSGIAKQLDTKQEPEALPPPPPPAPASSSIQQSNMEILLSELIDKKLASLTQSQVQPIQPIQPTPIRPTSQDKDFAMIEESLVEAPIPVKEVKEKPKLPRLTPATKIKLEAKRLVIEAGDRRAEFEQLVTEFNTNRSIQNEAKKKVDEARGTILGTMSDNLLYDGDTLAVSIKEISNQSVNAAAVVEALVDLNSNSMEEIKAGVQQILDLARLGIIELGKTSFERWVKGHGYDPEPFIIQHEKEKRIYVTPK